MNVCLVKESNLILFLIFPSLYPRHEMPPVLYFVWHQLSHSGVGFVSLARYSLGTLVYKNLVAEGLIGLWLLTLHFFFLYLSLEKFPIKGSDRVWHRLPQVYLGLILHLDQASCHIL